MTTEIRGEDWYGDELARPDVCQGFLIGGQ
jgi:hypothetical protein